MFTAIFARNVVNSPCEFCSSLQCLSPSCLPHDCSVYPFPARPRCTWPVLLVVRRSDCLWQKQYQPVLHCTRQVPMLCRADYATAKGRLTGLALHSASLSCCAGLTRPSHCLWEAILVVLQCLGSVLQLAGITMMADFTLHLAKLASAAYLATMHRSRTCIQLVLTPCRADYAISVFVLGFLVTLAGQGSTYWLMSRLQRRSIVIIAMAGLMLLATVVMYYETVVSFLGALHHHALTERGHICTQRCKSNVSV